MLRAKFVILLALTLIEGFFLFLYGMPRQIGETLPITTQISSDSVWNSLAYFLGEKNGQDA
jgi:hypothetical protein